jgi:ADP-ribosyl-[dinitrogen reductase] hydrolase
MIPKIDKYRGAMLGLAVGDALGVSLEFMPPGSFVEVTEMLGGGPFNLKPGEWTDDTSMALCLASSLIECDKFDAHDQMTRYLDWRDNGYMSSRGGGKPCVDIGNTTTGAISNFEETGDPFSGPKESHTSGNGSIMRLVPIPLYYGGSPIDTFAFAGESSITTHGSKECKDACRYMALIINGAINGLVKEDLLSSDYMKDIDLDPQIKDIANGSFKEKEPPEIKGTGYVVESLEAALWAFYKNDTFEDGLIAAVNLGDDADTTGAVFGQIAGAYYGVDFIPERWIEKIVDADGIMYIAETLYDMAIERYGEEYGNDKE